MRLDAMKRQAGRPRKENSDPVGPNLIGTRSNSLLAEETGESTSQIKRFIRLAVLTLISEANYEKLTADNRRDWIIGTLLFLILLLVVSVGMSHRFVKPILRSLKALQEDTLTDENLSGISEVDALVDFMQKKRNTEKLENGGIPPNIEEMLKAFALRVETLTPSERMVLQYYVDGYTIQEIASLLYISIGTARKHNTNMNRKLGITVREELMLYIELFRKCDQLDKLTYSRTE